MVRRSGVAGLDGGEQSTLYGQQSAQAADSGTDAPARAFKGSGGGRWTIWPMRVLLWAALLIVAYRGVTAIALNEVPASQTGTQGATTTASSAFPVTLAQAYALEFAQVYLNFSPGQANQRAQQLAQFIPSDASAVDPEFGWNGSGDLRLGSAHVAGVDVRDSSHAVVIVLASVNGQLMELGVPIYTAGGGLVVSGEPAWLPAPPTIQTATQPQGNSDQVAQTALMSQLPAFFQAYASGDTATLNRFLAQGVTLNGLGGTVTFVSIANMSVPPGGSTRDITVTVNWQLTGSGASAAQLATTYDMSVVDQQSGKWYVEGIRASTQPVGSQ